MVVLDWFELIGKGGKMDGGLKTDPPQHKKLTARKEAPQPLPKANRKGAKEAQGAQEKNI